ncbi:hypothetical protein V1507DRAFT_438559 [Lipomyces tetrasporus]
MAPMMTYLDPTSGDPLLGSVTLEPGTDISHSPLHAQTVTHGDVNLSVTQFVDPVIGAMILQYSDWTFDSENGENLASSTIPYMVDGMDVKETLPDTGDRAGGSTAPENDTSSSKNFIAENSSARTKNTTVQDASNMSKTKRGRPTYSSQDSRAKRREQICKAQRAYRERKERTITNLQSRVRTLEAVVEQMQSSFVEVCDLGLQAAVEHDDSQFTDTLANVTRPVLALVRDADCNEEAEIGPRISTGVQASMYPGSSISARASLMSPLSILSASCAIANPSGTGYVYGPPQNRQAVILDKLYRHAYRWARTALMSPQNYAREISRIFPTGIDIFAAIEYLGLWLSEVSLIDSTTYSDRVNDDSIMPGFTSPWTIAEQVKWAERGKENMTVNLDVLALSLDGRGICTAEGLRSRWWILILGF